MNKALFLDRDGVINKDINYLCKVEDFEFIDGIFELCHYFVENGFMIIVVTNQAGIARGFYTEDDFHNLTDWMVDEFKKRRVELKKIYYCPFHATEGIGKYKRDSYDRKPNPGMLLKAQEEFNLNLEHSILVGDKESDIEAGINAGVGMNVLFANKRTRIDSTRADIIITDLRELVRVLTMR